MEEKCCYRQTGRDALYKIWHTTGNNMVIYMHAGSGSIVFGDKIYPITAGTLCFIGAEKYHYTMPELPEQYCRSKLFLSPEDSLRLLSALPENHLTKTFSPQNAVCAVLPASLREEAEILFRSVSDFRTGDRCYAAQLCACYLRLLIMLDTYACVPSAAPPDFAFQAVAYIHRNIASPLTIDELCRHLHISKYHFCRKFKSALGVTPMEYILKTRLMLAKNMLVEETLSVSEIAGKCGFSGVSYFCRVFKESEGRTPLQFRKGISSETPSVSNRSPVP